MPCCSLQKNTRKRRRNLVFSNSIHSGRECSRSRVSSRNGRWFALVVVVVLVVNQASELASGFDMNIRQSISRSAGTTPHSARWRRTTLQLRVVEVDTLSPTMIKEAEKEETIRLPPWLATQRSSATNTLQQQQEQLQEELQWLQWTLMDRRLSEELVEEILQAIRVACRGNIEWMLGCVDFLQTLLRLEQVATPTVVLASIVHYVECAAARTDGVYSYDTVQQRLTLGDSLERVSGHRLALPPSSVLEGRSETHTETRFDSISQSAKARRKQKRGSSSLKHKENRIPSSPIQDGMSFSSFLSGSLTSEILHISNGASQIKRAEIVAEVVLPRQADYEKVQNLLVSVSGDDWRALAIRCVASLHRLEGGTIQASTHLYQNEDRHPQMIATARNAIHVYAPLAQRMGLHVLKTQLESKAFSILYPRQYKAALALFDRQGDSMQAVSRYLQQQITQLLQQDPNLGTTDIQVTARVKEPYSFWKKLLRKNRSTTNHMGRSMILRFDAELSRRELASILQVRDGVALRVIVQAPPLDRDDESLEESRARDQLVCYYVHQLIRAVFPETDPSGVKDYIQSPKANGYQSLHHTSVIRRDTLEIPFEVQVRSQEMHQIAEFGFAAHWDYKQHKKQQQQTSHHRPPLTACVPALPPADTDPPTSELDSERAVFYTITAAEQEALTSASNDANEVPSPSSISSPYLQALEVARQSLVESSVFVFLAGTTMEHGQLMVVKKGERIMDIWANLLQESDLISTRTLQAWRNGRWADLDEQVQNGDVLLFQFQQEHETSSVGAKKKNLLLQKASARLASAVE